LKRTPQEICPPELRKGDIFKRVTFKNNGKMTANELAEEMNRQRQALCIVNSREAAQNMYELLEEEGRFHLSTLMPPAERQKQLAIIREHLAAGESCRVVSTSLVEAGVDLDFPTVYRELAGLDSILQAAGRCNRNGKNPLEASEVTVFDAEWTTPKMLKTAISACEYVWNGTDDPSDEQVIRRYFGELLFLKGDEAQDTQRIMNMMKNRTLPFADIADAFRMIDSNAVTVYIPTEESRPLIEQYRSGIINRALMRKLGRFGVTVYPNHLKALLETGDVETLGGNVYVLLNEEMYAEQTGLSMKVDQGKALFI
jgi:CRISPR-associated endonuclease/helicase Cas3